MRSNCEGVKVIEVDLVNYLQNIWQNIDLSVTKRCFLSFCHVTQLGHILSIHVPA